MQPPTPPPAWTPMPPTNQQPWGGPPYMGGPGPYGNYTPPPKSNAGLIVGIVVAAVVAVLVGLGAVGYVVATKAAKTPATFTATDGSCEVRVPSMWSREPHLNDKANLQIANKLGEEYLLVMTEAKADFTPEMTLDRYAGIIIDQMKTGGTIKNIVVTEPTHLTVGGLPALQYEVEGTIDYINLRYLITFVDGKTRYHQVMTWTLKTRFADKKQDLMDATSSFREH